MRKRFDFLSTFNYQLSTNRGFTLLELLVVVAILGSLMGLAASNFMSSQSKGRDARRKSDLTQIQRALELYYNDHSGYPDDSGSNQIVACGGAGNSTCAWGTVFEDENDTVYMEILPAERMSGFSYHYHVSADNLSYQIFAHLENENDPMIATYSKSCGGANCNYGVSSPNVSPGDNI